MKRYWMITVFSIMFCLCATSLAAQQLNWSLEGEVELQPDDHDARSYFPVKDQNDNLCALIKVKLTNKLKNELVLEVGGVGVTKREEQKNGEIWFWVPYQAKNLHFSCFEYVDLKPIPVRLEQGKVYRLTLRSDAIMQMVTNVEMTTNFLKMSIQPEEVTVYIGKTPACELDVKYVTDGYFNKQLDYGEYYYRIENPYYETLTGTVTVSGENIEHKKQLQPAYSYLEFKSEPSGALVIVDGEVLGQTPLRSDKKFKRGPLQVRLQKEEYSPLITTIQVKGDGQTQTGYFQLDAQFAVVTCTSADPQAEIWVDNTYRGVGSWTGNLSSTMTHILEARRPSHQSQSISFTVESGQTLTKTVGAPVALYGIFSLETTPNNCVISIDGKEVGSSPLMQQMLIGKHQVIVRKEGYLTEQFEVDIQHQKTLSLQKTLEKGRLIADVTLKTKAGAELYANQQYLGKAEQGTWKGQLQEGKYEFRSVMAEHHDGKTVFEIVGQGPFTVVINDPVHQTGAVNITTRSGASVYLRQEGADEQYRKVGTSSYNNSSLPTGQYAAYASKKGYYNSPTKYFNVKDGKTTSFELNLKKQRWITSTTLFDTKIFAEINYGFGQEVSGNIVRNYSANFWGGTAGYLPDRWGAYFSGMYGAECGEFAATVGPLLRLNDADLDCQLYLGAGLITGAQMNWLGEAGFRLALDVTETTFEPLSLTLGAKFNTDLILPQIGVGLAPLALLANDQSDFSWFCLEYLTGYDTNYGSWMYGFTFSHCMTNLGIYTSMMWGGGNSSYVVGPVIRLTSDWRDVDFQVYGGPGYIGDGWGGDLGLRLDFPWDSALGFWDFSLGCQFYDGGVIPYVGMSWAIALVGGWATSLFGIDYDSY